MIENSLYWFVTLPPRAKAGFFGVVLVVSITACLAAVAITQAQGPGPARTPSPTAAVDVDAGATAAAAATSTAEQTSTAGAGSTITAPVESPADATSTSIAPSPTMPEVTPTVATDQRATEEARLAEDATATAAESATQASVAATASAPVPTLAPETPTDAPAPPTETPVPPSSTPVPPTATRVPPTPAPPTPAPPTPATVEGQISALIASAANRAAGQRGSCRLARELLPSGRFSIDLRCELEAGAAGSVGRNIAFEVHRALWTSELPIGAVRVRVSFRGQAPIVDAMAGYTVMQGHDWADATQESWVSFLRANARRDGDPEGRAWYDGSAP